MQGWYINNGPLGIQHLVGEKAICKTRQRTHFDLQFDNLNLPMCYTHGWRTFHKVEVVLQLSILDDFIYLAYCGKEYRRKLRGDKFQFHNLELTYSKE